MTNDKLTGLAFITAMLLCFGVSMADNAQAKTAHRPKYGYTIHRAQHIKCPYAGCHKDFNSH